MKNLSVEKILRDMARRHGGNLLPEVVIEEAKDKRHPLHGRFEWDNTRAAHEHRLHQARQLIRVCVTVVSPTIDPLPVFVSLSTSRSSGEGYQVLTEVLSNKEKREQLLNDALHELNLFQKKYSTLRELAGVFAASKQLRKTA